MLGLVRSGEVDEPGRSGDASDHGVDVDQDAELTLRGLHLVSVDLFRDVTDCRVLSLGPVALQDVLVKLVGFVVSLKTFDVDSRQPGDGRGDGPGGAELGQSSAGPGSNHGDSSTHHFDRNGTSR